MHTHNRIPLHALIASLLLAFAFVGCGKKDTTDDTTETADAKKPPLSIAYSDWPGWVAWQVAAEKGFFEKAGVEVKLEWLEYVPSMDAFAAGKVDACCMTNGDTLVTGAGGGKGVMILLNDYSNGNDMVVAKAGINSIKDLKGKKVGVEIGFVSHLLLLKALEANGLTEDDIELVNVATDKTPETLASGGVDAIVAWQPNSGQALKASPGSKALYTSADAKGLIYDVLAVTPQSLATRRADWAKVIDAWYMAVDFIKDPATTDEAVKIMAARVDIPPEEYKEFLKGTFILTRDEALAIAKPANGFGSLLGSSKISDDFNVKYEAYKEAQDLDSYIDMSLFETGK